MELGRFTTLGMLGLSWDKALGTNADFFVPLNSELSLFDDESEDKPEAIDAISTHIAAFIRAVADAQSTLPSDRPDWFKSLEVAAGAQVLEAAEQAGHADIDVLELLYAVEESDDPAAQFILCRLNTPVTPERVLSSGLDLAQAKGFFGILVATLHQSDPTVEWFKELQQSESYEALLIAAKKAGFSMTIEEFREVLSDAEGDDEVTTADWVYMVMSSYS
jgi:hypothetical protein